MPTVTLLDKAYGSFPPQALEPTLQSLCKDLNVQVRVKSKTVHEWVQAEVSGQDEVVALRLLDKEIGLAPAQVDNVRKFSLLRGRIINSGETATELHVDVGVFTPKVVHATVSLQRLQAQLIDGKKLPLQSIIKLYCLHDNMPLQVKIVDEESAKERDYLEAELSEQQLDQFTSWLHSSLDRLMVSGARLQDVEHAIDVSNHFRDVAKIESLGWLEHVVMCKLGTDAVGLIPPLGRFLPKALFAPFSPRKIALVVNRLVL